MKKRHLLLIFCASMFLSACSSTRSESVRLAEERATLLSPYLPYSEPPLRINSARAKQNVVEIEMIYNAKNVSAVSKHIRGASVLNSYCKDPDVKSALDHGVVYRHLVRNIKGKVILDSYIDHSACEQ